MDLATETAIKAILLSLHRSKTISAEQMEGIIAELTLAAGDLAPRDADAAADIERLTGWLRAAAPKPETPQGRLSRF